MLEAPAQVVVTASVARWWPPKGLAGDLPTRQVMLDVRLVMSGASGKQSAHPLTALRGNRMLQV